MNILLRMKASYLTNISKGIRVYPQNRVKKIARTEGTLPGAIHGVRITNRLI